MQDAIQSFTIVQIFSEASFSIADNVYYFPCFPGMSPSQSRSDRSDASPGPLRKSPQKFSFKSEYSSHTVCRELENNSYRVKKTMA